MKRNYEVAKGNVVQRDTQDTIYSLNIQNRN